MSPPPMSPCSGSFAELERRQEVAGVVEEGLDHVRAARRHGEIANGAVTVMVSVKPWSSGQYVVGARVARLVGEEHVAGDVARS